MPMSIPGPKDLTLISLLGYLSARISRMLESEIEVGLQPLVRVYITGKGGLGVGLFRKAG